MTPKKFSKLSFKERIAFVADHTGYSPQDLESELKAAYENEVLAEKLIESSIGYYGMPLGMVEKVSLNGQDYVVPMAIEETSVIAALNNASKWVREKGEIKASIRSTKHGLIGQMHIPNPQALHRLKTLIETHKEGWIKQGNQGPAKGMVGRGGGIKDIELRTYRHVLGHEAAVLHVYVDVCDAMGANVINQVCEFLKPFVEQQTGELVHMCILSNYNDHQSLKVVCTIDGVEEEMGKAIETTSMIAESDVYRAVTHNKGIMNGIDGILMATGNDFRAVEAGLHAYASRSGAYKPLSTWRYEKGTLTGIFEGPIHVGVVGGVTRVHPTADLALQMLGVRHKEEFACVIGAVGLLQNLAAVRALSTIGVVKGHMRLHIKNILMTVDATENEQVHLEQALTKILLEKKYVSRSNAVEVLEKIRA